MGWPTGQFDERRPLAKAEQVNKILQYCRINEIELSPDLLSPSSRLFAKVPEVNILLKCFKDEGIQLPESLLTTKPRLLLEDLPSEILQRIAAYLLYAIEYGQLLPSIHSRLFFILPPLPHTKPGEDESLPLETVFFLNRLTLKSVGFVVLEAFCFSAVMARAAFTQFLSLHRVGISSEQLVNPVYHPDGKVTLGQEGRSKITIARGQVRRLLVRIRFHHSSGVRNYVESLKYFLRIFSKLRLMFPGVVDFCFEHWVHGDPMEQTRWLLDDDLNGEAHTMAYFDLLHAASRLPIAQKSILYRPDIFGPDNIPFRRVMGPGYFEKDEILDHNIWHDGETALQFYPLWKQRRLLGCANSSGSADQDQGEGSWTEDGETTDEYAGLALLFNGA